jgi:hypothetical protein
MPPLICPRCKHTNPEIAVFCHFDGEPLRDGQARAGATHGQGSAFLFPSGRRCATIAELAQGCEEEWAAACELLRRGEFHRYFASLGQYPLARTAFEAMHHPDANLGLACLLHSLPVSRPQGPRLDFNPRRVDLGNVLAGVTHQLEMTVSNKGVGTLCGTVTIAEGSAWLRVGGHAQSQVRTTHEQRITLLVDTRGLPASKSYGTKLTVASNGGVLEVPVWLNVIAHPFPRPPFGGARTPGELIQRMCTQVSAAALVLESGDVARWFTANGWNYPVRGNRAGGAAGVQQFFECMGLSSPPLVYLSHAEVRYLCTYPDSVRGQVLLLTGSRKWVYAHVESDAPWLRVVTTQVAGLQQASIAFEVDSRLVPRCRTAEGTLRVSAPPRWYLASGKQRLGPYSLEHLRALKTARKLHGGDMLLPYGGTTWVAASSVKELGLEDRQRG